MKGEARMADLSLLQGPVQKIQCTQFLQFLPAGRIEGMKQVQVNAIGIQPGELLIEVTIHIGLLVDHP